MQTTTKQKFPNESTLETYVRTNVKILIQPIANELTQLANDYTENLALHKKGGLLGIVSIGCFLLAFLIFRLAIDGLNSGFTIVNISIIVLLVGVGCVLLYQGMIKVQRAYSVIRAFNQKLNHLLFPAAFSLFGIQAHYVKQQVLTPQPKKDFRTSLRLLGRPVSHEYTQVLALLDHSQLVTEPRNTVIVDDMVSAVYGGQTLFLSELNVQHVTHSGKNGNVKHIFSGYFISLDLARPLTGKTFISTEGDKNGFGNQSFLSSITGNDIQPTTLEWNEFEALLHVVTSDPIEARYILTPDLMADLYDWWKDKKQNIRLSFIDNRLYILFPDTHIKFTHTIKTVDENELLEYLLSIARPLLHVVHLLEDVQARVNR